MFKNEVKISGINLDATIYDYHYYYYYSFISTLHLLMRIFRDCMNWTCRHAILDIYKCVMCDQNGGFLN